MIQAIGKILTKLGFLLLPVLVLFACLGVWTERNLEFWLAYFKGVPVDVPFWLAFLLSLVLNGLIVGINLISEIIRLAM